MQQLSPEQAAQLQEKLKSMSPDELKEYQKQSCIFCQIISGKVASKKIYEDNSVIGVLDINPANPGHVLLLPKEHFPIMPLLPDDAVKRMFSAAKNISRAMFMFLEAKGTTIFAANGTAAGQKAQHFMLHIIPRYENDNVGMIIQPRETKKEILRQINEALAPRVAKAFGIKSKEDSGNDMHAADWEDKQPEAHEKQQEHETKKGAVETHSAEDIIEMLGGTSKEKERGGTEKHGDADNGGQQDDEDTDDEDDGRQEDSGSDDKDSGSADNGEDDSRDEGTEEEKDDSSDKDTEEDKDDSADLDEVASLFR